ncbi:MAG: hypothetical protein R3D88_00990 [Alphaproteobacteria bacterium]|nr:hypothetical protein [Alphaproteobacteria bacterium]
MHKPSLEQEMRCSILSNANGDIVILHDKPITSDIQWIEFDVNKLQLNLVHEDGTTQDLGISIEQKMAKNLKNGTEVQLTLLENKEIKTINKVTIIIQEY